MVRRQSSLPAGSLALAVLWAEVAAAPLSAGQHPTLLITPDDVPRLRHACGLAPPPADAMDPGRAGMRAPDFQALRAHFAKRVGSVADHDI